jgi:hypothetical protein
MCFDNLIKFFASHYYYIEKTIWYQPIYTLQPCFQWHGYLFQKKKEKNLNIKNLSIFQII